MQLIWVSCSSPNHPSLSSPAGLAMQNREPSFLRLFVGKDYSVANEPCCHSKSGAILIPQKRRRREHRVNGEGREEGREEPRNFVFNHSLFSVWSLSSPSRRKISIQNFPACAITSTFFAKEFFGRKNLSEQKVLSRSCGSAHCKYQPPLPSFVVVSYP